MSLPRASFNCKVSAEGADSGALGALVWTETGDLALIACNHVIAWNGRVSAGSQIRVASRNQFLHDQTGAVAKLADWTRLEHDEDNLADCAYATLASNFLQDFDTTGLFLEDVGDAAVGDRVVRRGGDVDGVVTDVSASIEVNYEFGTYRLVKQILIRSGSRQPFATAGDSGSIVLRVKGNTQIPVAMVWGGHRDLTYASPLRTCLDALKLTWVAPGN